jgi:DNA repair photolyase
MILNTGMRTDIPAFFSRWFYERVRAGEVLVRNPYYPQQVTRYRLSPEVVDCLCFCTKNPAPMLDRLEELREFRQFWFVTVTPYGQDVEPGVPETGQVLASVRELARAVGPQAVSWRYDPIFLTEKYDLDFHIRAFSAMAAQLQGAVDQCVISFLDLYEKTKRNFPEGRAVAPADQQTLASEFVRVGKQYGITIRSCCEDAALASCGVDVDGCMTQAVLERAMGVKLEVPKGIRPPRQQCSCLMGNDIGAYNTCPHGCRYCYANEDQALVRQNLRRHDPSSPFLIGGPQPGDVVRDARQESWVTEQLSFSI